jgi:hypothetical protein
MLHACVERFDVMSGRGNILSWVGEVNKAKHKMIEEPSSRPSDGCYQL